MPLLEPLCYFFHREALLHKDFIYLITYFKVLQGDTWTYDGAHLFGLRSKCVSHCSYSLLRNTCHRTTPACMNGCNGMMVGIINNNWYTVGCRHTDTHVWHICDKSIYILKSQLSF